MSRIALFTLTLALAVMSTGRAEGQAQETAPAPAPAAAAAPAPSQAAQPEAPAVPDASYLAVKDSDVRLVLRSGMEVAGRLLTVESRFVTLIVPPSGNVVSVEKKDVIVLQVTSLATPTPPPAARPTPGASEPPEEETAESNRHFAINLGIPPEIALDLDYSYLYIFGDVSIVFPAATDGEWVPMSWGAGVNFPPASNKRWKLEIFAQYSPMRMSGNGDWIHGFGVGLGVHYTADSGLTFGFKTPIFGYSATSDGYHFSGEAVTMYYLASGVGLPLVSLGYRF